MLADNTAEAVRWGERAIALAESLGDAETLVHALNKVDHADGLEAAALGSSYFWGV